MTARIRYASFPKAKSPPRQVLRCIAKERAERALLRQQELLTELGQPVDLPLSRRDCITSYQPAPVRLYGLRNMTVMIGTRKGCATRLTRCTVTRAARIG